jgi:hypothetical protein
MSRNERSLRLKGSIIVGVLMIGLFAEGGALIAASSSSSLNLVQVTIQTAEGLPFQYALTAYNSSGYQVANYYGGFPEAAFGLPSGTYLITASASYQSAICYPCPLDAAKNGSAAVYYRPPESEYGYAVEAVNGPIEVTIATQNSTQAPLTSYPIHVAFANGTAAAGAYVSGYVVGSSYSYSDQWVTYGQTSKDGNFTLVLPAAPVEVSASLSLPIQLPKNVSTVTVLVGGQKVNVTVYWQPNSIYLTGQALILPPQKGADITLQVQQSYPYPIYYGGASPAQGGAVTTTTSTTTTTAAGQQAASTTMTNRISPFNATGGELSPGSSPGQASSWTLGAGTLVAGVVAAALVGFGAALVLGRRLQSAKGARP